MPSERERHNMVEARAHRIRMLEIPADWLIAQPADPTVAGEHLDVGEDLRVGPFGQCPPTRFPLKPRLRLLRRSLGMTPPCDCVSPQPVARGRASRPVLPSASSCGEYDLADRASRERHDARRPAQTCRLPLCGVVPRLALRAAPPPRVRPDRGRHYAGTVRTRRGHELDDRRQVRQRCGSHAETKRPDLGRRHLSRWHSSSLTHASSARTRAERRVVGTVRSIFNRPPRSSRHPPGEGYPGGVCPRGARNRTPVRPYADAPERAFDGAHLAPRRSSSATSARPCLPACLPCGAWQLVTSSRPVRVRLRARVRGPYPWRRSSGRPSRAGHLATGADGRGVARVSSALIRQLRNP